MTGPLLRFRRQRSGGVMERGARGMTGRLVVISGWKSLMSGGWRESSRGRFLAAYLFFAALGLVTMVVNATSVLHDRAAVGRPVAQWEPWTWEATSLAAWMMLVPLIFIAVQRVWPPRVRPLAAAGLHLLLTILVSLSHVGIMVGLRYLAYWAHGESYRLTSSFGDVLLYEYRKDFATYALVATFFVLFERVAKPTRPEGRSDFRIQVKDRGVVRHVAPEDVEWAQAAGNYVELRGRFGTLLLRSSLAALTKELEPHGFRQIHRTRIVRQDAIAAIETKSSGDFEVTLASGTRLNGSRRYRRATAHFARSQTQPPPPHSDDQRTLDNP